MPPSRDAATVADGTRRAQSHVVGVALLLGATVVALGVLTAGIGAVVEHNAATADAGRVAGGMESTLEPVEVTGLHHGRIAFSRGELRTVERDLRLLNGSGVVRRVAADALVFEGGGRRVVYAGGAVVRGRPGNAWLYDPPPLTVGPDVLVVGAVRLNASRSSTAVAGRGGVVVPVTTRVSHDRTALPAGRYRIAVETATPDAWRRYFEGRGATVRIRTFDDDGVPSVVVDAGRVEDAYLVVHDLGLEVGRGP
jgi:hypothetical protein